MLLSNTGSRIDGRASILCLVPLSFLFLGACATVTSETRTDIVVDGSVYEIRTRTIEGTNGPYVKSHAMIGSYAVPCLRDSPGDCEAAVRRGLENTPDASR